MWPTRHEPNLEIDAATLGVGACLWVVLTGAAAGSGTSLGALDGLIVLAVLALVSGIGSMGTEAPSAEESWYQYEGSVRGL